MRSVVYMFFGLLLGTMIGVVGTFGSFSMMIAPVTAPIVEPVQKVLVFLFDPWGQHYRPVDLRSQWLYGVGATALTGAILGYLVGVPFDLWSWYRKGGQQRKEQGTQPFGSHLRSLGRLALLLVPAGVGVVVLFAVIRPGESPAGRAYRVCRPYGLSEAEVTQLIDDYRFWTPEGDMRMTQLYFEVLHGDGRVCVQAIVDAAAADR